ncbi:hypothetical protein LQW54_005673 [Pestalotiopsis sp. IQ-011]
MSYFPTHTHDNRHSAQLVDMHLALDREAAMYLSVPSSKKSKSHKSSDAASVASRSSFSSTRQLLKSKFLSPSSSSRWSRKSEKDYL